MSVVALPEDDLQRTVVRARLRPESAKARPIGAKGSPGVAWRHVIWKLETGRDEVLQEVNKLSCLKISMSVCHSTYRNTYRSEFNKSEDGRRPRLRGAAEQPLRSACN